jgi:hypothetical protein
VSLILCQSSEGSRREKCEGIKEEVVILSVAVGAGNRKMSDGLTAGARRGVVVRWRCIALR